MILGGCAFELNLGGLEMQRVAFRQALERAAPAVFEKIQDWFQEHFVDNPSRIVILRPPLFELSEAENGQEPTSLPGLYAALQASMSQASRYPHDPLSRALFAEILFEMVNRRL